MKKLLVPILLLILSVLAAETFPLPVGEFAPRSYTAFRTVEGIKVDGSLDDIDWQLAPPTELFTDIEGDLKPAPHLDTWVKMLWDASGLYIGAWLEEPHIWASLTERDAVIFYDNDFEVFLDPNGDTHEYYELEINALGTLWDLFILKPYRDAHSPLNGWDIKGASFAIGIDGTLNDPSDLDSGWSVEMFLPWPAFEEFAHVPCPPRDGDYWRLNFSRVQWDTEWLDGNYTKVPGMPERNWVWSPQGLIAMHYPERWGYLFFSAAPAGSADPGFSPSASEREKEYLRQIYYLQKQYFMDQGRSPGNLRQLGVRPYLRDGKKVKPRLETTSAGFDLTLPGKGGSPDWIIREDGRIWSKPVK